MALFAQSLQETLRISACFALVAAILALFYRKEDARPRTDLIPKN